jgi:hypothetical protein
MAEAMVGNVMCTYRIYNSTHLVDHCVPSLLVQSAQLLEVTSLDTAAFPPHASWFVLHCTVFVMLYLLELVQLLCAQQHPPAATSSSRLNKDAASIAVTGGVCATTAEAVAACESENFESHMQLKH